MAIKCLKIDPSSKYKVVQAYRELAILDFLSLQTKQLNLPNIFTNYQGVFCPKKEIEDNRIYHIFIVMNVAKLTLRDMVS